ncbi:MAG: IS3 family transposase [Thiobacillaceae bacterium]
MGTNPETSPFTGEGHRKVWARLRILPDIRVSRARVLRLMRENQLLSPHRRPQGSPTLHDGTITTELRLLNNKCNLHTSSLVVAYSIVDFFWEEFSMSNSSNKNRNTFLINAPNKAVPYSIIMLDKDYRICSHDHSARALFGYEDTSLMGKHVCGLLPGLEDKHNPGPEMLISPPDLKNHLMDAMHTSGKIFPVAVAMRDLPAGNQRYLLMVRNLDRHSA